MAYCQRMNCQNSSINDDHTLTICQSYASYMLRACHTLAISVNDRVPHGKIIKIIENAGD